MLEDNPGRVMSMVGTMTTFKTNHSKPDWIAYADKHEQMVECWHAKKQPIAAPRC